MNTPQTKPRPGAKRPPRVGIFPCLVLALALVTLILFFVDTRPGTVLSRAAKKTADSLESPVLSMLYKASQHGTLTATGKGETVTYIADLPARALVQKEGEGAFSLHLEQDSAAITLPAQFSGARTAERKQLSAILQENNLALSAEDRVRLRLWSALCDPDLAAPKTRTALSLALQKEKGKAKIASSLYLDKDGEEVSCRAVVYTYDSKRALTFLQTFFDNASFDEIGAGLEALYALQNETLAVERRQAIAYAFAPLGTETTFILSAMSDPSATLTVTHCMASGALVETRIDLSSPRLTLTGALRYGVGGKAGDVTRGSFSVTKDGAEALSLSFLARVTEDTKKAFLSEAEYSLTDATGLFTESADQSLSGKMRFSLGKEKKDIGLRLVAGDSETYFRALLNEKADQNGVSLTLNSWEENRRNTLRHPWDIVIQTTAGNLPAMPASEGTLLTESSASEETP